ncbi:MAG: GGDEF domain-containing protein [Firmicutes bacterium]|nr:GGDEF domain-containing protein [Bacillota bacterium]
MQVEVGYCDHPDSALAGNLAAQQALIASGRGERCDLVLLFCTARHDELVLRREIAKITGNSHCIFGGGAAGIITNDAFGYAGDQVGVACIWLDGSSYQVLSAGGLSDDEFNTGMRLGEKLAKVGVTPYSPVMLFYDAVHRTPAPGHSRLVMSTWLLEGIEKQLGFLPDLMGAGLQGDHILTPTRQFLGHTTEESHAFALTFSNDIHIDNVILHGCHPASPYYTVTKADGSTILEIDGKPAIPFIDELLGSSIAPDEYPFFLIFGINHGAADEDFDEKNYASRLCQSIDKERGGIVMFEPDMVAGTKFQVMYRTQEPDYIPPKLENLLAGLGDREPFFAIYINCAGRCAGYGGNDIEDARVIQDVVQDRFPLFGLYSGVEIASIGGKARSLDWTGVFCVFSKGRGAVGGERRAGQDKGRVWAAPKTASHREKNLSYRQVEKFCVQNMAKVLALDAQNIAIRNELEQKRRGFSLLAELSVSLRDVGDSETDLFLATTRRINAALNMQKTVLLFPGAKGYFIPAVLQGYTEEEKEALMGKQIKIDPALLSTAKAVLVTAADDRSFLADLRAILNIPYFISTPIVVENKLAGILITGRMMEAPPFLSRLNENEAETVQAIATLLASTMVYQRLDEAYRQARTDALTGLYNRGALEQQVALLLKQEFPEDVISAFILIDLDHFKDINDSYGHIVGDRVLRDFARILSNSFRSTDIISRFGGDEFVAFCTPARGLEGIQARIKKLIGDWSKRPLYTEEGTAFYSTLSIGVAIAPKHGTTYIELLRKADVALYETKQSGRNGCFIYDEKTMKRATHWIPS